MTFVNASLLLGLAVVSVPIYLHLSGRRQPKRVVFGSLFLLQQTLSTTRTRVRLERWWLLLARAIAIAAMAMALASPAVAGGVIERIGWASVVMALGLAAVLAATIMTIYRWPFAVVIAVTAIGILLMVSGAAVSALAVSTGPAVVAAEGPVSLAIVIDNGPTSKQRWGETTVLERWRREAVDLVNRLPGGSEVAVVDRGGLETGWLRGGDAAATAIANIESVDDALPIMTCVASASRLSPSQPSDALSTSVHVVLLTDRSEGAWASEIATPAGTIDEFDQQVSKAKRSDVEGAMDQLGDRRLAEGANQSVGLNDEGVSEEPVDVETPTRTIHVVAPEISHPRQWQLAVPRITPSMPPPSTPVRVTTQVFLAKAANQDDQRGQGDQSDGGPLEATVELGLFDSDPALPVIRDGKLVLPSIKPVDRRLISVEPGSSAEVVLSIPELEIGTHHGVVRLTVQDELTLDNQRYVTIEISDQGKVLLVGDNQDESVVIEETIADLCGGVTSIASRDLSLVELSDFAAVVLLDPSNSILRGDSLDRYIRGGGAAMFALGPAITPDNGDWPIWLGNPRRRWRAAEPGTFLRLGNVGQTFADGLDSETPWIEFPIQQYWRVDLSTDDAIDRRVFLKYAATDHPAVIQTSDRSDGEAESLGWKTIVWTTPLPALTPETQQWNQLFDSDPWPVWLAVRGCVETLLDRGRMERIVESGQSVMLRRSELTDDDQLTRVQWFVPDATTAIPISLGENETLLGPLRESGVHWIRGADRPTGLSVNVPRSQTTLTQIPLETIPKLLAASSPDEVQVQDSIETVELRSDEDGRPTPISSPLLILATLAIIAEQWLGRRG